MKKRDDLDAIRGILLWLLISASTWALATGVLYLIL